MADGTNKKVEDIKIGDLVWSYKIDDCDIIKKEEPSIVTKISRRFVNNLMSIYGGYDNLALRLTPDHLVFTEEGWKPAGKLTYDDKFLMIWKGNTIKIEDRPPPRKDAWKFRKNKSRRLSKYEIHTIKLRMVKRNPMKSEECRLKVSRTVTSQYLSGVRHLPSKYGMGNYSDGQTSLYEILDSLGVDYIKEFSIKADDGCPNKARIFVDAAIPSKKVILEYDGFPFHSFNSVKKKDKERSDWLAKKGWTIIRITGNEIQNTPEVKKLLKIKLCNHRHFTKFERITKYDKRKFSEFIWKSGFVFDLETSPNHNFVANKTLVHNCLYCFTNSLMRNPERYKAKKRFIERTGIRQKEWDIKTFTAFLRRDLNNDWTKAMYPLMDKGQPVQFGALGEPFDEKERETGWALRALDIIEKVKQPIRISSKGGEVLLQDQYIDAFKKAHKYVWVNFSIIHPEDKLMSRIECGVPSPTKRFMAMKTLSEVGVKTGLRYRPIIPQLAIRKINGEPAWKIMIDKAVEAKATALSFEFIFLNQLADPSQRGFYQRIAEVIGEPDFIQWIKHHSVRNQVCLRTNRLLKYGLFTKIYNYAKEQGLQIGVSDPHFKEFSQSDCCCGILDDDPIFGNFSHENLTHLVVEGRKAYEKNGDNLRFSFGDWAPEWAKKVKLSMMVCLSDADGHKKYANCTWYDQLRNHWNDPSHFRSPYYYFEGILHPVELDDNKDVIYEYRHWEGQVFKDEDRLKKERERDGLMPMPQSRPLGAFA